MNLKTGDRIGDYGILGVLGAGGMGSVFKARNVISDRVEALKVLLPNLAEHQDLKDRFLREIKTSASLEHPNIAALRTAFQSGDMLLMVMEFVEGQTLDARLKSGPMPIDEAVRYTAQVLDALEYAHSRGVVHRDIKPANVMITAKGTAKLLDFGIAKASTDKQLTMTGTTLGSLYYMSPEQIRGEHVDARADLYSLGITLYELITGKRPFGGDSGYAIMAEHLQKQPIPPVELDSRVPQALNAVILRSLAKNACDRFQDAGEFRAALRNVAFGPSSTQPSMQDATMPRSAVPAPDAAGTLPKAAPMPPAFGQPPVPSAPAPQFAAASPAPQRPPHQPATSQPQAFQSASSQGGNTGSGEKKPKNTLALVLIAAIALLMVGAVGVVVASTYFFSGDTTTATGTQPGMLDRIAGMFASKDSGTETAEATQESVDPQSAETDPASLKQASDQMALDSIAADPNGSLSAPALSAERTDAGVAASAAAGARARADTASGNTTHAGAAVSTAAAALANKKAPATAYPQQGAGSAGYGDSSAGSTAQPSTSIPKVDPRELEASRDFFAKLGIRAGTIQESARKLEQEQSALGVSLRGDIRASLKRMEYLMDRSEAALNNEELGQAKTQMEYAEREIEKLEKFFRI